MKKIIFIIFVIIFMINCPTEDNNKSITDGNKLTQSYLIDHNDTDISGLTGTQISNAAGINIYMEHASVGGNIYNGLDLIYTDDNDFDYSNFIFYNRGNPGAKAKFDGFNTRITDSTDSNYQNPSNYDAMMSKLCYIDNAHDGFSNVTEMFNYYRDIMNNLETQYPNTFFVWWTIPIKTTGLADRDTYNNLIRNYCNNNNKVLFDIADIECHSAAGTYLTDSSSYEIMDSSYSDDGGHLNDTGRRRVASAFWNLALTIYEIKNN